MQPFLCIKMVVAMNKDAISIIQQQAEAILDRLGIPVSVFIDMTYRQVIMRDGVPFSLDIPDKLVARDSITQAEFDTMMQTGLAQVKKNDSYLLMRLLIN